MRRRLVASIVAGCVAAGAVGCTGGDGGAACPRTVDVDLVAEPGTERMLRDLADSFNASAAARPPEGPGEGTGAAGGAGEAAACARVVVHPLAASRAEALLAGGWRRAPADRPRPVVWAPGASTWATLLDQRRAEAGDRAIAYDVTPIARSPLVVALPRSRAEALGWPDQPIRLEDLLRLAAADLTSGCGSDDAPAGMRLLVERWCAEDWGPFRLGKPNPELSATGLAALVVQAYAATGDVDGLRVDDLDDPWVVRSAEAAEAAVARYGESPRRYLDTLHRAEAVGRDGEGDGRAVAAPDVTGIVVEEKAVIDYNRGDPAGTLGPGESGVRPADRLVAIYPAEGTVELDGPLVVLDVPWAGADERAGARRFVGYVRSADVQRRVLDYGFRPVEPTVEVEGPLFSPSGYGVAPDPAVPTLPIPDATVLGALRDGWHDQRRRARVLLVVDVSGSMGDPSDIRDVGSPAKLDLVTRALTDVLDRFEDDDEVGLWVFSTALRGPGTRADGQVRERVPLRRMDAGRGRQRRSLANAIGALRPRNDTALHAATAEAHAAVVRDHDPDRINAVVLLTDGHDEVGGPAARRAAAQRALLDDLAAPARRDQPVAVFTVAYGGDADLDVLGRIAAATNGAFYDSTDPATIDLVLAEAVGNV
jgi:Ca-activated chloride channel family protein